MQFKFTLQRNSNVGVVPIIYQYPLNSAIYKITQKSNAENSRFLQEKTYGKGCRFYNLEIAETAKFLETNKKLHHEPV